MSLHVFIIGTGIFVVRDDSFFGELITEEEIKYFAHLENIPGKCKDFISNSLDKYPVSANS